MRTEAHAYQQKTEFSSKILQSPGSSTPKTYDISFDRIRASHQRAEVTGNEDYIEKRDAFVSYINSQMETHLGERFNVSLSEFEYDVKDGQMWGKDMDEPFIESMKRGRDYRKEHGNVVDRAREEAEVIGFEKIQSVLLDPETPIGTMMLSISPRGDEDSTYQHNFYDIFTLKKTESGKPYVQARRYASGLNISDYREMLLPFTNIDIDASDPAASFLSQPIVISGALTPDDIHSYLHKKHYTMDEKVFEIIKKQCRGLAEEYARSVWVEPYNIERQKLLFNAYLNKSDELAEIIEGEGTGVWGKILPVTTAAMIEEDIGKYAYQEVRQVMTGCGASEGYAVLAPSTKPFSVVEYGEDDGLGPRDVECPSCKTVSRRPYKGYIRRCPNGQNKDEEKRCKNPTAIFC